MKLEILPFEAADIRDVLEWNEGKGEGFLAQWAGSGYTYPLTYIQVAEKLSQPHENGEASAIYKIELEEDSITRMIGTVELNEAGMPRKSAMICRYLLSPEARGKGYGTLALMLLVRMAFTELSYSMLRLKVFKYNDAAVKCYEKAGFRIVDRETWSNGLEVLEMEIKKKPKMRAFSTWFKAWGCRS
jgi:RimJ/RimL family protein N-acetyltransferase